MMSPSNYRHHKKDPSKELLITRSSRINCQSAVLRMLRPIAQLLSLRTSEEISRVTVSVGLSTLRSKHGATHP